MKIGNGLGLLLASSVFLAGCTGFWDAPPSTPTTPVTPTTLSSGYFYILDASTSQVISYYINSGTLTLVGSAAVPATPIAFTVAPNNNFLYVSTLDGIYLYAITNGVLTLENSSQAIATDSAVAMQVDSTNSWLVETAGLGTLNAVPVSSTTGELYSARGNCPNQTVQSVICTVPLTGATIHQLAISPNNQYVFVACGTNGTAAFSFASGNGANPFGSAAYAIESPVINTTGSALSVAVDPTNRLLYIGEANAVSSSGGLRAFTIATNGALTQVSGSPYASGGSGPYAILPKSTGDYVYVANWNGTSAGNVTGFSISDTNSVFSLSQLSSSVATGIQPMSLAEDSDDQFVLAVSSGGSPYFDAYYFDTTTAGKLDTSITSSSYAETALAANH